MTVLSLPVTVAFGATMACLTPVRGRYLRENRPALFDLNFRMFFQSGLREPEFGAAHKYVEYLDKSPQVLDSTRCAILDAHLGPTWPTRFALHHRRTPFLVVRALARDFRSFASRYVWIALREEPESVEEYLD